VWLNPSFPAWKLIRVKIYGKAVDKVLVWLRGFCNSCWYK